jgi:AcrR family transcriptional regulator
MPNRDRRAERREATRREILDVAWDLAREHGLAGLTLRDIAARVGMRPPSLYSHFDSKHAIYDAMFAEGWQAVVDLSRATELPPEPRAALHVMARAFFDFAVANPARNELLNLRTIPGFEPSPAAYAVAREALAALTGLLARAGVADLAAADLFTALISGLINQQIANEPGGERWRRLLHRSIEMYADEIQLPEERTSS